jgi:hypothetical protein
MPSASAKQHRFMEAVAHNPAFAKKVGISQSVGKDFSAADKGKKFGRGGAINKQDTQHGSMDMPFKSLKKFGGMKSGGKVRRFQEGGFSAEQVKWLGGADRTDPHILRRMRNAVPDKAPVEERTITPVSRAPVEKRAITPAPPAAPAKGGVSEGQNPNIDAATRARAVAYVKKQDKAPSVAKPATLKSKIVTKEQLEESGLILRDYLNRERGLTRRAEPMPSAKSNAEADFAQFGIATRRAEPMPSAKSNPAVAAAPTKPAAKPKIDAENDEFAKK